MTPVKLRCNGCAIECELTAKNSELFAYSLQDIIFVCPFVEGPRGVDFSDWVEVDDASD